MITKRGIMKNEMVTKIVMNVLLFLIILLVAGVSVVKAQDNKTIDEPKFTKGGFPKILDEGEWSSQLIYDTIGACYSGTIRWIIMSNPSLVGKPPNLIAQRQMVEHCFCVMDKVRKEHKLEEYRVKVFDPEWTGETFMLKAMECVKKYKTLPSFFTDIIVIPLDNETNKNNKTIVPEGETEDSKEKSPDQKQEESEGSPQTIFQG